MFYQNYVKRLFDFILALVAVIILCPVFLIVAVLVRIQMGSPVLFSQERVGKDEKIFRLYKFRSMTNAKDEQGNLLDEKERITKFGSFIRSLSIDEFPELFHILSGKMSFIGPRPLPKYYFPYYREEERARHKVRGGLIPADTISGKAIVSWDEQLRLDVEYAENCSFLLDIKILMATFKVLFIRSTEDYGSADRPHLNEERSGVRENISR